MKRRMGGYRPRFDGGGRFNRREFLSLAALTAAGLAARAPAAELPAPAEKGGGNMALYAGKPMDEIRVGIIGLGERGQGAVWRLARIADVKIAALCDLFEERVKRAQRAIQRRNRPPAEEYFGGETAWERLCDLDLDLVYIATPWRWHTPMAVRALERGKHAASEVPAAVTIEECWRLVEASERAKRHCMMLENTCYDSFELATLNMVRKGVLGEIVHAEGAYIHDLFGELFDKERYQGMWRLIQNRDRNGDLYPTHGVGPVAQCMNVNRGDRFIRLASLSSNDFMLGPKSRELAGRDSFYEPYASDNYRGQMNTSIIKTANGKSVMIQHDTTSPRPYSRIHLLSGTKGLIQKWPDKRASFGHEWLEEAELNDLLARYEHPLYRQIGEIARKVGGHGGMDFVMDYRLMYCLKNGLPLDQNVYDAAAWSAVAPLSEASIKAGSSAVEFPDFTRGRWKKTPPWDVVTVDPRKLRVSA